MLETWKQSQDLERCFKRYATLIPNLYSDKDVTLTPEKKTGYQRPHYYEVEFETELLEPLEGQVTETTPVPGTEYCRASETYNTTAAFSVEARKYRNYRWQHRKQADSVQRASLRQRSWRAVINPPPNPSQVQSYFYETL